MGNVMISEILKIPIIITNPSGPILGASDEVAPTSPPTHLKYTKMIE
jgi:hypothetical protein